MAYEKRIQLLLPDQLQNEIVARNTVSEAVRTSLERYFYVIKIARKTLKAKLTIDEIMYLCDIFKDFDGNVCDVIFAPQFKEAEPELKIKWNIEEDKLLKRLNTLSPVECLALFDVIERYWRAVGTGMKVDTTGLLD